MSKKFKFDPYTNFEKGEVEIAKAIWNAGMAIPVENCPDRYKVSDEVAKVMGFRIGYWDHEADKVISTNPWEYGEVKILGEPYVLIYKD